MRASEEILRKAIGIIPFATMNPSQGKAIIAAIKEAQIEAIKECSRVAKELLDEVEGIDFGVPEMFQEIIDQIK